MDNVYLVHHSEVWEEHLDNTVYASLSEESAVFHAENIWSRVKDDHDAVAVTLLPLGRKLANTEMLGYIWKDGKRLSNEA